MRSEKLYWGLVLLRVGLILYAVFSLAVSLPGGKAKWLAFLAANRGIVMVAAGAYILVTGSLLLLKSARLAWLVLIADAVVCFSVLMSLQADLLPLLLLPGLDLGLVARHLHPMLLGANTVLQLGVLYLIYIEGKLPIGTFVHFGLKALLMSSTGFLAGSAIFWAVKEKRQEEGLLDLIQVGQQIGSTLNYEKVSALLMKVLKTMFEAHTYGLYVIEERSGERMAVMRGAESPYRQVFLDFNIEIKNSVLSEVIAEKKPRVIFDLRFQSDQIVAKLPSFRGGLFCPIRFEDEVLGILFLISGTTGAYGQEEETLLQLLSNQFAVTLKNVLLYQETATMAITDSLTGLYTHGYFQDQLAKMLSDSKYNGKPISLIILDVDHFKIVNDNFGHPQGDYILRQMSGLVRAAVRPEDVVSRYGGDEFVLIIPGLDRMSSAVYAERIRKAIEDYTFVTGNRTVHITVSAGVSSFPESSQTTKELIDAADKALYEAKHRGRNRIVYL